MAGLPFLAVAHARAMFDGERNFIGAELDGKIGAGYLGLIEARAFEPGVGEIHATQIGVAKIAVAEVEAAGVDTAQVQTPQIAVSQIATFSRRFAPIELHDVAVPQQLVQRVGVGQRSERRIERRRVRHTTQ